VTDTHCKCSMRKLDDTLHVKQGFTLPLPYVLESPISTAR
jgi:hypothetical protein